MIPSNLTQLTQAAISLTKEVTTKWNARLAGSEACLQCGDYLKEQMAAFCDQTHEQEFPIRPGAFLGYIRINVVLYVLALIALFFQQSGLATALASLSVLITVLEFFIYKEFVDVFFPLKKGKNVWGIITPASEVKQQIIISAHHDSAHIFNFLEKNPRTYPIKVLAGVGTQMAMFLFTWLLWGLEMINIQHPLFYWSLVGILALGVINLWPLWFFYSKQGTPGAGDNLVCTALAMEIGKHFAHQKTTGNPLKYTQVVIASWDAEECGLRGARAFTQKFKSDLQTLKTYNFNLECMYDHEELSFLVSDLNNFVPLSSTMASDCSRISKEIGFDIGTSKFPFLGGGTDAAEFAKIGVEATTLVGMSWTEREPNTAYHTTRDTIDAVDPEAVSRSIAVGIQYVLEKEREVVSNKKQPTT